MMNKHANNFDLLRMLLALIVVVAHAGILSQSSALSPLTTFFDPELAVDGFFVVSGFLVSMSFEQSSSVRSYFEKRFRRIYPAYFAVVIVCSLVLIFVSDRNAMDYFGADWIKYLMSNLAFLNFIHPDLPGVFEGHRVNAVNGALWTIKIEVMFYLILPLLIFVMRRFRHGIVIVAIYLASVAYSAVMQWLGSKPGGHMYILLERQLPGQLAFFMAGTLLHYYFDRFYQYRIPLLLVGLFGFFAARHFPILYPVYPMMLALVVIYFACGLRYLGNWGKYGDFSYGIYIWHFPLIQIFIAVGLFSSMPYLAAGLLLLTVTLMAFVSWHLVEKPFLRRTSHYRQVELH